VSLTVRGFPGVVRRGVTETAVNLDSRIGFDLGTALSQRFGQAGACGE